MANEKWEWHTTHDTLQEAHTGVAVSRGAAGHAGCDMHAGVPLHAGYDMHATSRLPWPLTAVRGAPTTGAPPVPSTATQHQGHQANSSHGKVSRLRPRAFRTTAHVRP